MRQAPTLQAPGSTIPALTTRYVVVRPTDRKLVAAFTCEPLSIYDLKRAAVSAIRSAGHPVAQLDTFIRSVWADREAPCLVAVPDGVQRYDATDERSIRDAFVLDDFTSYVCVGALR